MGLILVMFHLSTIGKRVHSVVLVACMLRKSFCMTVTQCAPSVVSIAIRPSHSGYTGSLVTLESGINVHP